MNDKNSLDPLVRAHLVGLWGPPIDEEVVSNEDGLNCTVLTWDREATPEQVTLLVTVGGSQAVRPRDPRHRIEFVFALEPPHREATLMLGALACYESETNSIIGPGDTVPFADDGNWNGKRRWLVLALGEPLVPMLEGPDGLHIEFLEVVPVFDSEMQFRSKRGVDALLAAWKKIREPIWDPG